MTSKSVAKRLEQLQIRNEFAKLDGELLLSVEDTCLYLGRSKRTLAEMRRDGWGPAFIQPFNPNSKAQNQHISYKLSTVREWLEKWTITSTMEGVELRGMAFGAYDLQDDEPFFKQDGKIFAHVYSLTIEEFRICREQGMEVDWLNWHTAMSQPWLNCENRSQFQDDYIQLLTLLLNQARTAGEATALAGESLASKGFTRDI